MDIAATHHYEILTHAIQAFVVKKEITEYLL